MNRTDVYGLKNAPFYYKAINTGLLMLSLLLLSWNWFLSLTILSWNKGISFHSNLGLQLYALAWEQTSIYLSLFAIQLVAYLCLWGMIRKLYQRMALRRRIKALLLSMSTGLLLTHILVWVSLPFFSFSQTVAPLVGVVSAGLLITMSALPIWRMWFFVSWKSSRPSRVVIVGGGFAGLYTALGLDRTLGYHKNLELLLIDQKNFFLFPPLLPSASVGTIETRQVTYPYRRIFETTNIQYQQAMVTSIDPSQKEIHMEIRVDEREPIQTTVSYDVLVLSPGSTTQTFNTPGVEEHAFFVREMKDAIQIRDRIIGCFERAAVVQEEATRRELLRFAIVGGGPTGIEIATEIQDLIHGILLKRYPEIHPSWPEVFIIQSGPQVLPGWSPSVVQTTTEQLQKMGIQLVLNNRVLEVRASGVILKEGAPVNARTTLWCAGVAPSPLLKKCALPLDASGRVTVDPFLHPTGMSDVFVLGDAACLVDPKTGKPLPPLGQVAFQQGDHMAKNLVRLLKGQPLLPFKYFNFGSLVSVGEHYAAVSLLGVKLKGFIGWVVWRSLYLGKIIGVSNKIRIFIDWTLDLFIERSISQLQEPHRHREAIQQPEEVSV